MSVQTDFNETLRQSDNQTDKQTDSLRLHKHEEKSSRAYFSAHSLQLPFAVAHCSPVWPWENMRNSSQLLQLLMQRHDIPNCIFRLATFWTSCTYIYISIYKYHLFGFFVWARGVGRQIAKAQTRLLIQHKGDYRIRTDAQQSRYEALVES